MIIDIVTLFPNMFEGFINESIIKRAIEKGTVSINLINPINTPKIRKNSINIHTSNLLTNLIFNVLAMSITS